MSSCTDPTPMTCTYCDNVFGGWDGTNCIVFAAHCAAMNGCSNGNFAACNKVTRETCDVGCQRENSCPRSSGTLNIRMATPENSDKSALCFVNGESANCAVGSSCNASGACALNGNDSGNNVNGAGLTTGAIIGIAVGGVAVLLLGLGIAILAWHRRRGSSLKTDVANDWNTSRSEDDKPSVSASHKSRSSKPTATGGADEDMQDMRSARFSGVHDNDNDNDNDNDDDANYRNVLPAVGKAGDDDNNSNDNYRSVLPAVGSKKTKDNKVDDHQTHADPVSLRLKTTDSNSNDRGAVWRIEANELTMGESLGKGSFGIVSRAKWHGDNVAVKQISKEAVGNPKAVLEFEREIGRMASMQAHKNVVILYGLTTLSNGNLGAVMEYCAHGSLMSALYGATQRKWSMAELFEVAYESACGVAHLHACKIVHRDIAARNVLLAGKKDVVAKVADFGLSRAADDERTVATKVEDGPVKWQAPEQLRSMQYSKASDVFSFGVLLFEIFAREAPWKGVNLYVVAPKVIEGQRMAVPANMPESIADVMKECWAQEPDKRPLMADVVAKIDSAMAAPTDYYDAPHASAVVRT
jgi:predicted Ser/Thr protein kinase